MSTKTQKSKINLIIRRIDKKLVVLIWRVVLNWKKYVAVWHLFIDSLLILQSHIGMIKLFAGFLASCLAEVMNFPRAFCQSVLRVVLKKNCYDDNLGSYVCFVLWLFYFILCQLINKFMILSKLPYEWHGKMKLFIGQRLNLFNF